jgi:hypothetical protein
MISDYDQVMGWTVAFLIVVAGGIALDFILTWYRARATHRDLELKTHGNQSWYDSHFDLRKDR